MLIIAPSILSADFSQLGSEINSVIENGADWIHVDVMDGHFVPNITIGAPVVKSIKKATGQFMDTHLMIEHPEKYVKDFLSAGSDLVCLHYESTSEDEINNCINEIKNAGKKCALAIKPKTSPEVLDGFLDVLDMVLIMTVEPGFGGQSFMEDMLPKIKYIRSRNENILIEVDGGINDVTVKKAVENGANVIVAGSYVFDGEYKDRIQKLRNV